MRNIYLFHFTTGTYLIVAESNFYKYIKTYIHLHRRFFSAENSWPYKQRGAVSAQNNITARIRDN
jgi:hypothetical protein